jgi:hypothetical protein
MHAHTGDTRLIRLNDVPRLPWIPTRRAGSKLHASTVWRWCLRGVAGIKLQHVRVGGTICVTECWLQDFFVALADTQSHGQTSPKPIQRTRDIAAAQLQLEKQGF